MNQCALAWTVALLLMQLAGCASRPAAPLWQPDMWPLASYRVALPALAGGLNLWIAVEADARGTQLVAFSPEGVQMLQATYSDGRLEQQFSPLRPAGLGAAALLEGWQLAFGPAGAVAAAYGPDCAFEFGLSGGPEPAGRAGAPPDSATGVRTLRCGGQVRARIEQHPLTTTVYFAAGTAQHWSTLAAEAGPASAAAP